MQRRSLTISASFHIVGFVLAVVGLPFLSKPHYVPPPPIIVEFVDIAKVTETDKFAPTPVKKPEEQKPAPAPKNTASAPVAPVQKEPPKPEEKKEVKKESKTAQEMDPNALPDKTKKIKKEEVKKEPEKDFSSVLKNLADEKQTPTPKTEEVSNKPTPAPEGQNASLGPKMTMSEEDALRAQLERCWSPPYGAKGVEEMVVQIFMVINPDRTLRDARIVDTGRYSTDSFYRALADSALRAVRNSLCSPFNLPPDKYETWKETTVNFNPKDMF